MRYTIDMPESKDHPSPQIEVAKRSLNRRDFLGRRFLGLNSLSRTDDSQDNNSAEGIFFTRALSRTLSRRELLKRGALAGVIAYSSLIESDHLSWVSLAKQFYASKSYEELEAERKIFYSKRQLFTEDDRQSLEKEPVRHKVAYVIVHPGYTDNEFLRELTRIEETKSIYGEKFATEMIEFANETRYGSSYGDYNKYLTGMVQLISQLNRSEELVIFALEQTDFYNPAIPRPNLLPGKSSKILVTATGMGFLFPEEDTLGTIEGPVYQKPQIMFDILRHAGVEEVRVAGEWSFYEDDLACLGGVAESFRETGFRVRGIQDAIFPNFKLEDFKQPPKDKDLLNSLYGSESIPLTEVLKNPFK